MHHIFVLCFVVCLGDFLTLWLSLAFWVRMIPAGILVTESATDSQRVKQILHLILLMLLLFHRGPLVLQINETLILI